MNHLQDCEEITRNYLSDLSSDLEWLIIAPQDEEEQKKKFELEQGVIRVLIEKIYIGKDCQIEVTIVLYLLGIIVSQANGVQIQSA